MTIRQHRYDYLKSKGFLSFEAREYSKIPLYADSLRLMINFRSRDYSIAGRPKLNSATWLKAIRQEYLAKGWEWQSAGVWRQYRFYEMLWKEKNPNRADRWKSPDKPESRRRYRDFNRELIRKHKP